MSGRVGPLSEIVVRVYFDFASSLSYVAHRVMERIEPALVRDGLRLEWRPIDLTRFGPWRRGRSLPEARVESLMAVASELEVELTPPRRWRDSRALHRTALTLSGRAEAQWREAVWHELYESPSTSDEPPVPAEESPSLLGSREEPWQALHARHGYEPLAAQPGDALERSCREAAALGVHGVPTFLLDVWPVCGIHEASTMHQLLSRFAQRQRARPPATH